MFDAWGKIPSGILVGSQYDFGSFDECLEVNYKENSSTTFVGQYCLAQIILPEQSARTKHYRPALVKSDVVVPSKGLGTTRMLPTFDTQ